MLKALPDIFACSLVLRLVFIVVLILDRYHSVEVRFRALIPPFVEQQSVSRNAWVYIAMVWNMALGRLRRMFGA